MMEGCPPVNQFFSHCCLFAISVAGKTDIGHWMFEATCRTGPSRFASQIFCSCCIVSQSVVLPAPTCAILRVSTAATVLQRERCQLMLLWTMEHSMSCCHLPAFGEHGNSAVDADASCTTAVVLCAAPGTSFDLQVRRHCRPCTPVGVARVHSSIGRDLLSCGGVCKAR
ncbi:unnamed protein product [Symbiodinium sp. CCMP2592]|nr:unnamed protein product [Symbiodinium sp. CCMP2592]